MELSVVCIAVERIQFGGERVPKYRVKFSNEAYDNVVELLMLLDTPSYIPGETYKLTIDP